MKMRSWLFAPGDSEKKMAKAVAGDADVVIFDLEDAVASENKPLARRMVHDYLAASAERRGRIWVRVNPLDGPHTLDDLVAIMPAQPGGIMLPKVYGRADVELLDHYLTAFEAAHGLARGSTPVVVLVTEIAEAMFHTGDYKGAPRVVGLSWGAEDLADSIGRDFLNMFAERVKQRPVWRAYGLAIDHPRNPRRQGKRCPPTGLHLRRMLETGRER